MEKQIKVLHVLSSKTYNGAENVVCQIINMFRDVTNYTMFYCSLDGPVRDALDENRIAFYPIKEVSVSEIKRVIDEIQPSIIHAHDMRASVFSALACGNIPLVSHIHNNNFDSRRISLKSILYFYAAMKAKHIFWVSKSSFNGYRFHNAIRNKSSILFNVINIERLKQKACLDPNSYDYDVVYVGRLTYPKNSARLIRVIHKAIEINPQLKAAIIGEGDESSQVQSYISDHNLVNNVDMLGFLSNPYKIMSDARCLIMTSLWEGTPMCALEAMALGLPIVSTPTDGLCELVIESETGYLSDNDDEMARYICLLSTDEEIHRKMSTQSAQRANELMSIDKYRASINNVYTEIV